MAQLHHRSPRLPAGILARRSLRSLHALTLLIAGALALSACSEATTPAGTPADVVVRAYVDADGSGSFTSGDVPLAGARIVLTSTDGAGTFEATTGADGTATFPGVRPGSYVTTFAGTVPEGAELATASSPTVVVPFQGGERRAEFRFVFHPGTISGVVFRDDSGSGGYVPGVDTPAPGVRVRLYAGGAAAGEPMDSTLTDAQGAFTFTRLRPGSYTLEIVPLPGIQIVDPVRQVTIQPAQPLMVPVRFTGSLRITVAEVRQRAAAGDSTTVLVEGVATAGTGILGATTTTTLYVQDETGGIMVFAAAGTVVSTGDRIRVSGPIGHFGRELQIGRSPAAERAVVEVLGAGTLPAPRTVTGAQVLARTFEGELVRAQGVEVTAVDGGTGAAFNVTVAHPDGTSFVVRITGAGTGLTRANFTVGQFYDITGLMGSFNDVPQLKPRSPADVVPSAGGPTPIAVVRERAVQGDSTEVTVQGVATVGTGILGAAAPTTTTIYVQDATGGIMVFAAPGTVVQTGDRIRVTGVLGHFGRELQIGTSANRAVVEVLGPGTLPAPRVVTGAQVLARTFEGELVRAENVEVTEVGGGTGPAFNVTVAHPDGQQFVVRVAGAGTGLTRANFAVGQRYDITGLMGSFNDVPQLKPRSPADVVAR